jgi:hypothetical protein
MSPKSDVQPDQHRLAAAAAATTSGSGAPLSPSWPTASASARRAADAQNIFTDLQIFRAAYRNRTDDLRITRRLEPSTGVQAVTSALFDWLLSPPVSVPVQGRC